MAEVILKNIKKIYPHQEPKKKKKGEPEKKTISNDSYAKAACFYSKMISRVVWSSIRTPLAVIAKVSSSIMPPQPSS